MNQADNTEDFANLMEELNVKAVEYGGEEVDFDFELTPELRAEGLMREIIRHIQATRKKAGLNVDDRIELNFTSENTEVLDAFKKFEQEISKEVLATKVEISKDELDFTQTVKVEGSEAKISLKKA